MLSRGQQQFDIDCVPCHGRAGDGEGMIVQRGFPKPPRVFRRSGQGQGAAFLRRDHPRPRRDVQLCRPGFAGRPVGDHRLYPRVAAQPAGAGRRPATARTTFAGGRTMRRAAFACCGGVCCWLGLFLSRGRCRGDAVLSGRWLFWSSLPVGALPVVMLLDLAGPGPVSGWSRRCGACVADAGRGRADDPGAGAAGAVVRLGLRPWFQHAVRPDWMTQAGSFRSICYAVLDRAGAAVPVAAVPWRGGTAARGRRGRSVRLCVTATLASVDWAMTVEPDWFSAEYGCC